MIPEIWEPEMKVVFVGTAVDELSDILGFYHLHPRDRFWDLVELGGITPKRFMSAAERKALTEGHARGTLSDPIRLIFIQKKTSQLLELGIGLTALNRRVTASGEKDKAAGPTEEDVRELAGKAERLVPRFLAFVMGPELFLEAFKSRYPGATATLGVQPFKIADTEVWLLGSPGIRLRGEALTEQEDAFFALGERISASGGY